MSYILEALKKSEARRRSGQAPDISQATPQTARRSRRWPLVLVTVVVLGAGSALGVWLATNRDADSTVIVNAGTTTSKLSSTTKSGIFVLSRWLYVLVCFNTENPRKFLASIANSNFALGLIMYRR